MDERDARRGATAISAQMPSLPGSGKTIYGTKGGEMGGKKGPIRERTGGQFFGDFDEDDSYDDADLDLMDDLKDSDEEDAG